MKAKPTKPKLQQIVVRMDVDALTRSIQASGEAYAARKVKEMLAGIVLDLQSNQRGLCATMDRFEERLTALEAKK